MLDLKPPPRLPRPSAEIATLDRPSTGVRGERFSPEGLPIVGPFEGYQMRFAQCPEGEAFFGGRAGPGKSFMLVWDALGLQFRTTPLGKAAIEVPEYRAVLFRRLSTQLDNLITEAHALYVNSTFRAKYSAQGKGEPGPSFRFPIYYRKGGVIGRSSLGAKIFCCHLQHEYDKHSHDGQNYQYVGWDELTHFTFTQYVYVSFSRARSKIPGLWVRRRSTGMPIGPGLPWVRRRFITALDPCVTKYFLRDDKTGDPRGVECMASHPDAVSRIFIPGKLEENLALDTDEYKAGVRQMGAQYERALLDADWEAFAGDFFKMWDRQKKLVAPFDIPSSWRLIGGLDPGWSSPCSFSLNAIDPDGNAYRLFTYYERERDAIQHAQGVKAMLETFPYTKGRMPDLIVAGVDAFHPRNRFEVGSSETVFADHFRDVGLHLRPATTARVPGWMAMKDQMNRGAFFVFQTFNQPFLEELIAAVADEKNPEDIQGRGNDPEVSDHSLDEARYVRMATTTPKKARTADETWATRLLGPGAKKKDGWRPGMG